MSTSVYLCADGTLTYGPYGGRDKIIKQALPVCVVEDEHEAELLIQLVGSKAYPDPEGDPDFAGRSIKPGYGPNHRYHYSLRNFERNNVDDLFKVHRTMEALRDAKRADDRAGVSTAIAEAQGVPA